jgi:hypothetical protein
MDKGNHGCYLRVRYYFWFRMSADYPEHITVVNFCCQRLSCSLRDHRILELMLVVSILDNLERRDHKHRPQIHPIENVSSEYQMEIGGIPKVGIGPSQTTPYDKNAANSKVAKGAAPLSTYFSPIQILRKEVEGQVPKKVEEFQIVLKLAETGATLELYVGSLISSSWRKGYPN